MGEVVGDGPVQGSQALPDGERCGGLIGGQQRAQDPVPNLGVEDREALPIGGQDVGVGVLIFRIRPLSFRRRRS